MWNQQEAKKMKKKYGFMMRKKSHYFNLLIFFDDDDYNNNDVGDDAYDDADECFNVCVCLLRLECDLFYVCINIDFITVALKVYYIIVVSCSHIMSTKL